jgi:hypothetical protein
MAALLERDAGEGKSVFAGEGIRKWVPRARKDLAGKLVRPFSLCFLLRNGIRGAVREMFLV